MFETLRAKIVSTFIAILTGIVILFLVSFNYIVVEQFKLQLAEELKTEINLIELGLLDVEEKKFDEHLTNLKDLSQQLKYNIILFDSDKNVLVAFYSDSTTLKQKYEVAYQKQSTKYLIESREYEQDERTFLVVTKVVDIELKNNFNKKISSITIESDLSGIRSFSNNVRFKIIVAALVFLVLGLIVIRFFTDKVTRPINNILEGLKEYSKTGVPKEIEVEGTGEFKYLIETINNLMKKIEDDLNELKKLERYRSEFLGNVSHELRTPIFSIQSYLETLIDGAINDPEVNLTYLKKAYENLERLNRLLSDLIDISQIESRQLKLSFRFFSINELIQKVIDDLQLRAEQKGIQLQFIKDENLKELVWGDKERLYQVFYNLIDNSIRYNPAGTKVLIYYKKQNSTLRIFVEDNGVGIPAEDLPRIFERFYRVNKERSRESGGTGLGLAIVKHIVEAHESKIYVESQMNSGTKFYFDLKIA
jgi:two-component system phosphate regulon sensor histidine kinase PhoR